MPIRRCVFIYSFVWFSGLVDALVLAAVSPLALSQYIWHYTLSKRLLNIYLNTLETGHVSISYSRWLLVTGKYNVVGLEKNVIHIYAIHVKY